MNDEKDMPVIDTSAPDQAAETKEPVAIEDLSPEMAALTDDIIGAMKSVYDPEIPVDIFELGLIFLCLYGLIFALLLTSKENNYYQRQR